MKTLSSLLLSLAAIVNLASAQVMGPPPNLIVNGGFETPVAPAGWGRVSFNSLPPWYVSNPNGRPAGSDIIGPVFWPAHTGIQSLDLLSDDCSIGNTLWQDIPTSIGENYRLSFWYANNVDSTWASARVKAQDGSTLLFDASIYHSGSTRQNMNWTLFEADFQAVGASTRILFSHTGAETLFPGQVGLVLDDVSVVVVPEPSAGALSLGCLLSLIFARSRKRGK